MKLHTNSINLFILSYLISYCIFSHLLGLTCHDILNNNSLIVNASNGKLITERLRYGVPIATFILLIAVENFDRI